MWKRSGKTGEEFGFAGCNSQSSCIAASLSEQLSAQLQVLKDMDGGMSKDQKRPEEWSPWVADMSCPLPTLPGMLWRVGGERKAVLVPARDSGVVSLAPNV